jgi:hypothetical protein
MEGINNPSFDEAGIEKFKYHFFYANKEIPGHPVIFDCKANTISEADALYEKKIGKVPEKQNHIGCSIVKL